MLDRIISNHRTLGTNHQQAEQYNAEADEALLELETLESKLNPPPCELCGTARQVLYRCPHCQAIREARL